MTEERALEMLSHAEAAEEPLGLCPDTHKPVYLKVGRFGPYVRAATPRTKRNPRTLRCSRG